MIGLLASAIVSVPVALAQPIPKKSREHIVLHTLAGDVELALYPSVAPHTSAKMLELTRLGVFDGAHFFRIEDHFVAQLSTAEDRSTPLTSVQKAALQPIPTEFSSLPHVRGVLSIPRKNDDSDSAASSFSILLGPAPHLDGKYTVFGEVVRGMGRWSAHCF